MRLRVVMAPSYRLPARGAAAIAKTMPRMAASVSEGSMSKSVRRAHENEAQHRLTIGKGETEVALSEIPQIEAELLGNRPVETELLPHLLHIPRRRGKVAHQRLHGVTWHHVNNEEVDHEDG